MASATPAADDASKAPAAADAPAPAPAEAAVAASGAGSDAADASPEALSPEAIAKIFADVGVPLPDDFEVPEGVDISKMSKKQLRKLVKRGGGKPKGGEDTAAAKAKKTVRISFPGRVDGKTAQSTTSPCAVDGFWLDGWQTSFAFDGSRLLTVWGLLQFIALRNKTAMFMVITPCWRHVTLAVRGIGVSWVDSRFSADLGDLQAEFEAKARANKAKASAKKSGKDKAVKLDLSTPAGEKKGAILCRGRFP
jgi:hypothetical protein